MLTQTQKKKVVKNQVLAKTPSQSISIKTGTGSGQVAGKFRPQVRSRHPSHSPFRRELPLLPFRSLIRFGSTTEVDDNLKRVELNTPDAIRNSSSKLLMKQCFDKAGVKTADWTPLANLNGFKTDKELFPCVVKSHMGSRNQGNTLIKTKAELDAFIQRHGTSGYIIEKFYNFNREYRLHVNADGCFYTCRKMLRNGTPDDQAWYRNDSNSVWIIEENPAFDKPVNWDDVVAESVKALKAVGLDFGAIDLRIQSSKDGKGKVRQNPDFIVLETNSAASMGEITLQKYLVELPIMLKKKFLTM